MPIYMAKSIVSYKRRMKPASTLLSEPHMNVRYLHTADITMSNTVSIKHKLHLCIGSTSTCTLMHMLVNLQLLKLACVINSDVRYTMGQQTFMYYTSVALEGKEREEVINIGMLQTHRETIC
jgi:hypothetical protein